MERSVDQTAPRDVQPGERRRISVVIPTLNEELWLPLLLDRLAAQTLRPDEIIVADNNSIDATAEIARARGAKVVPGGLPGPARNHGAAAATGDLIVFMDADLQPPPDFLAKAVEEYTTRGLGIAAVPIRAVEDSLKLRLMFWLTELYVRATERFAPHSPGLCILVDRQVFEQIGGFDETLVMGEDHDLGNRASKVSRYGILRSVKAPTTMRRADKNGWVNFTLATLYAELRVLAGLPLRKVPFDYEFGAFGDAAPKPTLTDRARRIVQQLRKPSTEVHGDAVGQAIGLFLGGILAAWLLPSTAIGTVAFLVLGVLAFALCLVVTYVLLIKASFERSYGPFFSTAVAVASDDVTDAAGRVLIREGVDEICELHVIRGRKRMAELSKQGTAGRLELMVQILEGVRGLQDDFEDPFYAEVRQVTARSDVSLIGALFRLGFTEVANPPRFDWINRVEKWVLMHVLGWRFGLKRETKADAYRMAIMTREQFTSPQTRAALDEMLTRSRAGLERLRAARA